LIDPAAKHANCLPALCFLGNKHDKTCAYHSAQPWGLGRNCSFRVYSAGQHACVGLATSSLLFIAILNVLLILRQKKLPAKPSAKNDTVPAIIIAMGC
jgi:hypothetical protein